MNEDTKKILKWLDRISNALGALLDDGVTDTVIDEIYGRARQIMRRLRKLLRRYRGKVELPAKARRWVTLAITIVQSVKAWIILRSSF